MYTPGYYKTNYRAARFRELVRMRGLAKGFTDYVVSRFMRPSGGIWMPSLWAETECKATDLSEDFQTANKPHRADFERLGFTECSFLKVTKTLNPNIIESAGVTYLNPGRCHFGQLLRHRIRMPSRGTELNQIIIAFTAAFEHGSLSCTNTRITFDAPGESEVIRVESHDVGFVYQNFLQHLRKRKETPRTFPDFESLRQWFDERQVKAFEERVQRRLFIPMTDAEVAAAQARLRGEKGPPPLPVQPPRINFRWGLWVVIIVAICALQFVKNRSFNKPGMRRSDAIEYRGQQFKMSKAYASYEDYKDDPNNLDTNELDRIEQVMVSAPVPASFKDRNELIHFAMSDLEFPGYGLSLLGAENQTDDGSKLHVESAEIPQREKERVIVVREFGGQLKLVDDFVYSTATNEITRAKLERQTLFYFDRKGGLVREKSLENL